MTGPGEGKLLLKNSKIYLSNQKIQAEVYIHVKGYSLARVTHLDIEHKIFNKIIKPKKGHFYSIHGIKGGIEIRAGKKSIFIFHPYLNEILADGEKTRTWVGGKFGGIYIGFKKEQVIKLERIAKEKFGFPI